MNEKTIQPVYISSQGPDNKFQENAADYGGAVYLTVGRY